LKISKANELKLSGKQPMEGSVLSFLQAEGKVSDTGSALTEPLVLLAIVLSVLLRFTRKGTKRDSKNRIRLPKREKH
jgi:hypothetical protein